MLSEYFCDILGHKKMDLCIVVFIFIFILFGKKKKKCHVANGKCRLWPRVPVSTWLTIGNVDTSHVADCSHVEYICQVDPVYVVDTSATWLVYVADVSRRGNRSMWHNGDVYTMDTL